jgi:hypothetical protein
VARSRKKGFFLKKAVKQETEEIILFIGIGNDRFTFMEQNLGKKNYYPKNVV